MNLLSLFVDMHNNEIMEKVVKEIFIYLFLLNQILDLGFWTGMK
jgi:hypothetical protein